MKNNDHPDGFVMCVKTSKRADKIEKREKKKGRKTDRLNQEFFGHNFHCVASY